MKSGSNLEKVLTAGHFAFTGELGPPRGAHAKEVREKVVHLKGRVDSVNITDNQTAVVRMASWAACLILIQEGIETWGGIQAELLKEPIKWEKGYLIPPAKPGLGVELNEEVAKLPARSMALMLKV